MEKIQWPRDMLGISEVVSSKKQNQLKKKERIGICENTLATVMATVSKALFFPPK